MYADLFLLLRKEFFVYFVVLFVVIGVFTPNPAIAQQTKNTTITIDSGIGQLCVTKINCFDPPISHIQTDTTVGWKNVDRSYHTVTSGSPSEKQVGMAFDSGLIAPGKVFTFTFKNAGTYHYFDEIHPWMRGEIVVT